MTSHRNGTTRWRVPLLVLLLVSGGVAGVEAQAPAAPPPRAEGSAEFAFVGTSGNSSTQTIGVGAELIYRPSPWESRLKVNYVRNEAEDELRAQTFVAALRVQRSIRARLAGYGQYGYQRDRFAGILARNTFETGLSFSLIDQAAQTLIVDGGVGYANEHRPVGSNLSTATLGTGGFYRLGISETAELTEDGRFVFSLPNGSDWHYVNTLALSAKLTTLLSLNVSNTIRYVNLPVFSFKSTDAVTAVALVAKF